MSTTDKKSGIENLVQSLLSIDVEQLLTPISNSQPSGPYLKYEEVYFEISKARSEDESFLPRGVWEHDLKRAEWHHVTDLCVETLLKKSKDLQIAMWLLEASVHRFGFDGLACGIWVAEQLCQHFWDDLHPQVEHEDIEYRINPLSWAAEKLLPAIRLIPIMQSEEQGVGITWSDWVIASERAEKGEVASGDQIDAAYVLNLLSRIDTPAIERFLFGVDKALNQLHQLTQTLDKLLGDQGPSFLAMANLVQDIQSFLNEELQRRGGLTHNFAESSEHGEGETQQEIPATQDNQINVTRNEAYRQVEQAARALLQFDPHSPAPYLILQACRWGTMDTRELYRELFVECGGQLNIFELLGVQTPADNAQA